MSIGQIAYFLCNVVEEIGSGSVNNMNTLSPGNSLVCIIEAVVAR